MNIKIVYKTKTHKLSQKAQTYQGIVSAIQQLYPHLEKGFALYITLNPTDPPFRIDEEQQFSRVVLSYKALDLNTMKFLIKDLNDAELSPQEICILNQSVVIKSGVDQLQGIQLQPQQVEKEQPQVIFQEPPKQEFQQASDFEQQSKPITCKAVEQEEIQQESHIEFQYIKQQQPSQQQEPSQQQQQQQQLFQQQQPLQQPRPDIQPLVVNLLDKRLTELGLIGAKVQKQQSAGHSDIIEQKDRVYKMKLVSISNSILTVKPSTPIQWTVTVQNSSNMVWKAGEIQLVCLSGFYKDLKFELERDVAPYENHVFQIYVKSPGPSKDVFFENEFKIFNAIQKVPFGVKITLSIKLENPIPEQLNSSIKQKDNQPEVKISMDPNHEKIKQIMEFTGLSQDKAKSLLHSKQNKNVQELIQDFLESQI